MVIRVRLASVGFLLLAVHSGVMAQQPRPGNYLDMLVATEKMVDQAEHGNAGKDKAAALWSALQFVAVAQSFVGDNDAAIATFDRGRRGVRQFHSVMSAEDKARIDGAVAEDAITAIVDQAKRHRVVMLNEAHHVPLGRAFAARLAVELRKIGYEYLACEGFGEKNGIVPLGAHGEVITGVGFGTGLYTQEPVFAEFVNRAAAQGWKLVPYEFDGNTNEQRERGQAQNLVDRIFAKDKNAKVLIYAGYDHVNKRAKDGGRKMMAAHLHELTGLDMLHVQQTNFFAHPDRAEEYEQYRYLVDKFNERQPFVLRAADGSHPLLLGMQDVVDMQVIFPRYGQIQGRPEWLSSLLGREPRPIPAELVPVAGRRIIKAYPRGAAEDDVATDVVTIQAGQPVPSLMLPKGEFEYRTEQD